MSDHQEITTIEKYTIKENVDVRLCRGAVRDFAASYHFDKLACEELALVVSEICSNVIKHAQEGELTLDTENHGRVLVIQLIDKGPGISDVSLAMKQGYSSVRGSLGLGLDIVRRLTDDMSIESITDQGTTIIVKKFLPLTDDLINYGLLSIADSGYMYNGDQYLIHEFDGDSVLMAVLDGVGQGLKAYLGATFLAKEIKSHYRLSPSEILAHCHAVFKKSELERGAAISIAKLTPGKIAYAGIGDTHAYWFTDKMEIFKNAAGVVGNPQFKNLETRVIEFETEGTLCLCSDGIRNLLARPKLEEMENMQQLAKSIYNSQVRAYGDATVLVARYKKTKS